MRKQIDKVKNFGKKMNENFDLRQQKVKDLTNLVDMIQNLQSELKYPKYTKIDRYIILHDEASYGGRTDIRMEWIDDGGGYFTWRNVEEDMYEEHNQKEHLTHYDIVDTWGKDNVDIILSELNTYRKELENDKELNNI